MASLTLSIIIHTYHQLHLNLKVVAVHSESSFPLNINLNWLRDKLGVVVRVALRSIHDEPCGQKQELAWVNRCVFTVHLDVVHALCSHTGVHLLVAIQLVSNSPVDWKFSDFFLTSGVFFVLTSGEFLIQFSSTRYSMFILPEKTSSIFAHGFDDVALPPHHSLKPVLVMVMPNNSKQIPISKCKLL